MPNKKLPTLKEQVKQLLCLICKRKAKIINKRKRLQTDPFSIVVRCSNCSIESRCYPDYQYEVSLKYALEWWNYNMKLLIKKRLTKSKAKKFWNSRKDF